MAHNSHPLIADNGLADGCERCAEIARDPFAGLDSNNFRLLAERTMAWMKDEQFPRSDTENVAMRHMEGAIVTARRLARAGIRVEGEGGSCSEVPPPKISTRRAEWL